MELAYANISAIDVKALKKQYKSGLDAYMKVLETGNDKLAKKIVNSLDRVWDIIQNVEACLDADKHLADEGNWLRTAYYSGDFNEEKRCEEHSKFWSDVYDQHRKALSKVLRRKAL